VRLLWSMNVTPYRRPSALDRNTRSMPFPRNSARNSLPMAAEHVAPLFALFKESSYLLLVRTDTDGLEVAYLPTTSMERSILLCLYSEIRASCCQISGSFCGCALSSLTGS
jgi:hypothetical protein